MRRRSILTLLLVAALVARCDSRVGTTPGPQPAAERDDPPTEGAATIAIHTGRDRSPISPYIYGANQDLPRGNLWTVRRLGGNRLTGYNWETNHSNAGSDWKHSSDNFLLTDADIPEAQWDEPARVMTYFHDRSLALGAESVLTLQLAGYVAADDDGPVTAAQTAPSARWDSVAYRKEAAFTLPPDRSDGTVYMDELVHRLTQRYGAASGAEGVRWYTLDNEPGLWAHTHPRIHPAKVRAEELVRRSIALASAVKAVSPQTHVTGPALYGFAAYLHLQEAPDWPTVGAGYDWFIDYYLDRMRAAGQTHGQRLLDVLDVHWYPEARGDHRIVSPEATTPADVEARLQAPRTLWDSTYTEKSWIADCCRQYLPILPRLQQAIDVHYPGTQLAISEYDYGAKNAISGGLAQADVLGAFGRHGVDLATLWGIEAGDTYAAAAFALYRNYDGQGGTYGNTAVQAQASDRKNISVYAAIAGDDPSTLHVMLINKNRAGPFEVQLAIESRVTYTTGEAWRFDAESASISQDNAFATTVDLAGNTFSYTLPRLSATHLVLRADS